jgi:hypothetical protein
MSATTTQRAITAEFSPNPIPNGIPYGVTDNSVGLKGTIGVIEASSGYLKMGVTGTGLVCVGRIDGDWDNTGTGHAAGAISVPVRLGVFPWYMGTSSDAIDNGDIGSVCYIIDNQTVGLTDGGGTRSVAGVIMGLQPLPSGGDAAYQQVYVQMGYYVQAIAAGAAPGGALLISGNQANTGVKTFSDATLLLNNSGGSFATTFHTDATAARSFTFPDIASAHAAALEGTQEWVGVKTWASTSDPLFKKEQDHTLKVDDTTTGATAGGALTIVAGLSGTSGTGGALTLKGGAGATAATGGAAALVGGAGGASSGTGGAASVTGGAGTAGNAVGGAASLVGGAGQGSAAGGASSLVGGVGGATGAGGAIAVTGGAGGATSGTGGAVVIAGGAGSNGNANGGALTLRGGAKNGAGTDGAMSIGATNTASIALGAAGISTTWTGNLLAAAAGLFGIGSAQALSGAGAVDVTHIVTNYTSTGGAQALTLADGTINGQIKFVHHTVDGGSGVLTPATAGNFATATFTNVHEWALFMWTGSAWNVLAASPISIIA